MAEDRLLAVMIRLDREAACHEARTQGERRTHVPEGYVEVTPYIFAADANAYDCFLAAAFGARQIGRSTAPNGRVANCQMRFGTATIMVSEASDAFPPSTAALYLYVADADAMMASGEAAGAVRIMDVADMPYAIARAACATLPATSGGCPRG